MRQSPSLCTIPLPLLPRPPVCPTTPSAVSFPPFCPSHYSHTGGWKIGSIPLLSWMNTTVLITLCSFITASVCEWTGSAVQSAFCSFTDQCSSNVRYRGSPKTPPHTHTQHCKKIIQNTKNLKNNKQIVHFFLNNVKIHLSIKDSGVFWPIECEWAVCLCSWSCLLFYEGASSLYGHSHRS